MRNINYKIIVLFIILSFLIIITSCKSKEQVECEKKGCVWVTVHLYNYEKCQCCIEYGNHCGMSAENTSYENLKCCEGLTCTQGSKFDKQNTEYYCQ